MSGDMRGDGVYCSICQRYSCEVPPENALWDWATTRALSHIRSLFGVEFEFPRRDITLEDGLLLSDLSTRRIGTRRALDQDPLGPQYLRWLSCPDQQCPECRRAEAAYLDASSEEQSAVLLMALDRSLATHETPLFGKPIATRPLVPLAAMATSGHASTTHRHRRATALLANLRATPLMAMASVAAALLIAFGLTSGTGRTNPPSALPSPPSAAGRGHTPAGTGTAGEAVAPGATLPATTSAVAPSVPVVLAAASTAPTGPAATVTAASLMSAPTGGGTANGTTPTTPTGPTGTAPVPPGALAPVTTVVGSILTSVGTSVGTTASRLGAAAPPVAPVIAVVGAVGSTLAGLGTSLGS